MSNLLQNLDLPANPLDVLLILDPGLLQDFNGNLLISQRVHSHFDFPKGALPQTFPKHIVT